MTSPVWHPFTQHGLREPIPRVTYAQGAILHTAEGRRIVDAISSWWVITHGHCHPRIAAAIADQAMRLDQLIFAGWTHEPAETLAADLIKLVGDELASRHLAHVFFSDSGSTCVEVALKMALGLWKRRRDPRHRFLVLEHSYHGDTIGAMAVGARGPFNRAFAPLLFDVGTLPFPAEHNEQATLDALDHACRHDAPAALLVEPLLLGAGGMLTYGASVLAEMAAICAHHRVPLIADEVLTGWGRTGTLLACQQAGITPDLLCLAKGLTGGSLPLAVTLASAEIFDAHCSTDRADMFYHSSSYTANPIACAAANANLAIWREEPVAARIATLVTAQAAGLAMLGRIPGLTAPRQCGTIIAMDVAQDSAAGYLSPLAPRLSALFADANVLLRPLGNTIYAMPPYAITPADLAQVHDAMAQAGGLA